jgi:hypothetical protein
MAWRPSLIDHVILPADQDRWHEELHRALDRRGHEGWTLVALLPGNTGEVERRSNGVHTGPATITLIFQRRVQRRQ